MRTHGASTLALTCAHQPRDRNRAQLELLVRAEPSRTLRIYLRDFGGVALEVSVANSQLVFSVWHRLYPLSDLEALRVLRIFADPAEYVHGVWVVDGHRAHRFTPLGSVKVTCGACAGSGWHRDAFPPAACPECGGSGQVQT